VATLGGAALLLAAMTTAAEPPPIIDVHLHSGSNATFLPEGPPYVICADPFIFAPIPPDKRRKTVPSVGDLYECQGEVLTSPATDQDLMNRTLAVMDRHNVTGVVSDWPLERLAKWRRARPERIIPAVLIYKGGPSPDEVRRLFEQGEIAVLGEIAVQYGGMAPNDPFLDPYWALAEELDMPAAIHIGMGTPGASYLGVTPDYRAALADPLPLEEVLLRHPRLRLYVMHAAWPFADRMMLLMFQHPQLYVDTGMISNSLTRKEFHRYLEILVDAGFHKRILFGSDSVQWPEFIVESIEAIETAGFLAPEQKRDIFYNNAVRFLRLGEKSD
jgi:predicted TIM-barrel fold metal-dependent hydrolase